MHKNYSLLPLCCMLIFGCGRADRLETAMRLAGNNAKELQKVLDHYTTEDSAGINPLKYRAAAFLIENMPGHISADSAKLKPIYDSVNSLLDVRAEMKGNKDSIIKYVQSLSYSDSMVVKDIEYVNSGFLIKHIDDAFAAWEKQWARHLTFEQFCEYLLPYKYSEYQRLDYWRDSLNKRFYEDAINQVAPNDLDCQFAYRPGKFLNDDFIAKMKIVLLERNSYLGPIPVHFNSKTLPRMSFGDCNDYAIANVAMMRSAGVPAVYEYTPQWGERASGRHGWSTVYNNNGFLPTPHIDKELGEVFFPTRKLPKIFRRQYAAVPEREKYVKNTKFVYADFVQFDKDVTAEYLPTTDLEIPVNTKGLADKYAYIAVSNFRDWNIVDFGIIKGKKAYFKDMGRDIVYLVMGYDGKELVAITDPFILESNGNIRILKPDKTHLDTLTLWRKYPRNTNTTSMEKRILGGKIQASNDSLFASAATFYEVKDLYYPDLISIASDTAYRFWRYLGVPQSYSNIAEVQFYKDGVDSMLIGKIYGAAGVNHADAFDGDWLTYYRSTNKWAPAWVGMDFGDTVRIDHVRLVPRSDDNGIHYGDTYELNYYADGQWNSRGQQKAKERFLVFDSVPRNSLLLLKNLSRGKEERIFIYENGKQVWW